MTRFIAVATLVTWLFLSPFPDGAAPVSAGPPDAERAVSTDDSESVTDANTDASPSAGIPGFSSVPLSETENQLTEESAHRDRVDASVGSVRPHGREAPVQLRQQDGKPKANDTEKKDEEPGDGPVVKKDQEPKPKDQDPTPLATRVWPMPAESYTFTQAFGCVEQLGNLYFSGEGCPAGAPVIHTGVDLAAPEGTLFYAAASGWVTLAGWDRPTADANTRIIIQHDGRNERFATDYLHWIAAYVEEGDYVRAGEPIGEVGSVGFSTGPHLHFSVTDLETGEHVDPMRWLPDEPGSDGYVGRTPNAHFRLPPGTTAGQPESADPAPPPRPVREKVPETPPADAGNDGGRSESKSKRQLDERRTKRDGKAASAKSDRGVRKSSSTEDPAADAAPDETANDATTNERERRRERDKNGTDAGTAERGKDGQNRGDPDEARNGNQRRNRDPETTSGGGGKEDPGNDRGGRDNGQGKDTGGRDARGGKDTASGKDGDAGGNGGHRGAGVGGGSKGKDGERAVGDNGGNGVKEKQGGNSNGGGSVNDDAGDGAVGRDGDTRDGVDATADQAVSEPPDGSKLEPAKTS